jgi:hypothetical protein
MILQLLHFAGYISNGISHGWQKILRILKKKVLTNGDEGKYSLWLKLEAKAEQLQFGVICCEMQVHEGKIKQLDITDTRERFRAD